MDGEKHLDSLILKVIKEQEDKGGFKLDILEIGTKLTIETKNSIYQIEIIEGGKITIMGGMRQNGDIRHPSPIEGTFIGSTWGSSLLKPNWFGQGMSMEIFRTGKGILRTSSLQNVKIELPSGRELDLEWGETN